MLYEVLVIKMTVKTRIGINHVLIELFERMNDYRRIVVEGVIEIETNNVGVSVHQPFFRDRG